MYVNEWVGVMKGIKHAYVCASTCVIIVSQ